MAWAPSGLSLGLLVPAVMLYIPVMRCMHVHLRAVINVCIAACTPQTCNAFCVWLQHEMRTSAKTSLRVRQFMRRRLYVSSVLY